MARYELPQDQIVDGFANGNSAEALLELGLMYSVGRDVCQDLVEAHKWFNLAAVRGNRDAKRYRSELTQEMSKQDVAKAQRLAREWLSMH